jgi:dipeptidase E
VGGGNAFYLSYWMQETGIFDELPRLLESKVYAGISAGSMIATPTIRTASAALENPEAYYDKDYDELGPKGRSAGRTAKLVPFVVRPHVGRKEYSKLTDEYLDNLQKELDIPLYAIDDQTALKVIDGKVEVVTEGKWKPYE